MSTFVRNVSVKRRKLVSSKGLNKRPEVKQCNWILSSYSYDAMTLTPYDLDLSGNNHIYRPYYLIGMFKPNTGAEEYERVGNKINVKWIRLKGYISVFDQLISTVRLKFFLVRSYGRSIADVSTFFNNWEVVDYTKSDVWAIMTAMRHNYYKATFNATNLGRDKGVVMSKICEIKINPSSHSMTGNGVGAHDIPVATIQGQAVQQVPKYLEQKQFEYEAVDNIPFDVRVSVQETIDCTRDYYYLYVMQDYPYCTTYNTVKNSTYYPYATKSRGYEANFFCRYYYTDA